MRACVRVYVCVPGVQKGQMGTGQMGTPKCAIFDAIFAIAGVLLAPPVRRQGRVCNFRSQMAPSTHLMSVDDTPLVLPRRRCVLPLLNHVEVRERLHICSASCLRRCVLQSKTLNDCIAILQLHRNFANFQKLQLNFRILHIKLHFFVSPSVPSPFGPPNGVLPVSMAGMGLPTSVEAEAPERSPQRHCEMLAT